MPVIAQTVLPLPWYVAAVSWGIALFEYLAQVWAAPCLCGAVYFVFRG